MRVLLVTQYYWPENFLINHLVPLLLARGVEVTVLTGKPNYPDGLMFPGYRAMGTQAEHHEGVEILRIPTFPRGRNSHTRLALNYFAFILAGTLLGRAAVGNRPYDLVFVYAPSPLLQALPAIRLAHRKKVPLIVWVQDLWPESLLATNAVKNQWILSLVGRCVRYIYRSSDRILVQSRAFVVSVANLVTNSEKIYYYPNLYPTDTEQPASQPALDLARRLRAQFSVVFAGNLGTAQSLETIIETARKLKNHPEISIVLVGSGSMDEWLQQQCAEYQLNNLVLAGRFDASDMDTIFQSASALLVSLRPSPTFSMTVPSKLQAYLAAGRPIIAALDGEGERIVHEAEAGFCSEAGNADALVENILRMAATSEANRLLMGGNGRRYFDKNFAPDALADELVTHFKETIRAMEQR
jgi:glycosyltransferase involved in cell wall biosynthesis